ncbi:calcium/proton exchanger [Colletotrichum tofieldiae]|nr:calcium/proton exchanger [Colletotrichum tofieldiae]GKT68823.1 calcium/proton exchanger [Colletotrichum tofieldiae]GKT88597.1 calcium/proton exchanger [Colletotrichum tofieldiae]
MSDNSVNQHFRGQVRSWGAPNKPNGRDGDADENSPLLVNGNSAIDENHVANGDSGDSSNKTLRFLFNSVHTPGTDSPNIAVRYASRAWHVTKVSLLSNYVNFLLVMVPLGVVAGKLHWSPTAVFTINSFAIIPLAAVLSFATKQISMTLSKALGGLINATFGNVVELIVSIVALKEGQIEVVQSSMLGSILSNLLLVMGMCFFFGGIVHMRDRVTGQGMEQNFGSATAQTTCSLMTLSSASLFIPATLYAVLGKVDSVEKDHSILVLSRGTAIVLMLLYVLYLWFQLRTHPNLFEAEVQYNNEEEAEEPEEPIIGPIAAAVVLVVTTVLVAICADYLVESIDPIVETAHISRNFIGLIPIPIIGNAAKHITAVLMAIRNKMDLAMGVVIGSSIRIALLVTPFLVILGWAVLDKPMTLHFEMFETVVFVFSMLVVTYILQDGKSNYLEGAMLLGLYVIIALAFYIGPIDALNKALSITQR